MDLNGLQHRIFHADDTRFEALVMEVFRYQSRYCDVYSRFLDCLQVNPSNISHSEDIPFLPIEFFKHHEVKSGTFTAEAVFESSSTGNTGISRNHVQSLSVYESSFTQSFNRFFGPHTNFCHLALLPSYLERQHSSLVYQVDYFIRHSAHAGSSFYLHNHEELARQLAYNETHHVPTVLWGVSFALLDFAQNYPMALRNTTLIETGGMKGRRAEITRDELHSILAGAFSKQSIAGEYGMTELMSQAYAVTGGIYQCPPWMRVSAREINDPLSKAGPGKHGVLNVTDLANLSTCAFIATSDLGKVYSDGRFEVLGRIDHSDARGCNLML